jgi:hypothetical protein
MNLFEKPHHKEECHCDECWRWMIDTKQVLIEQLSEAEQKYRLSIALLEKPSRIEYLFNTEQNCRGYWIDKQWCGGVLGEAIEVAAKRQQAEKAGRAGE